MSWDVSIVDRDDTEIQYVGNYTYNVSPMYLKAMGVTLGDFHGKPAHEVLGVLRRGIDNMQENPEEYQVLNPTNGWGKYEGAITFLNKIYKSCYENTGMYIKVY